MQTAFTSDYNFTHRIDHFSFGEPTPGIICPMDTMEKYADSGKYFICVYVI